MQKRLLRFAECFSLFFVLPTLMFFWVPFPILPLLWVFAGGCVGLLIRDPTFDRTDLTRISALRGGLRSLLIRVLVSAIVLFIVVWMVAPTLLFNLIKHRPWLWLLIVFLYPLLSVYPQELIYRTYFFHRYGVLIPNKWFLIALNAMLFGYMHVLFHNWIAVGLTTAGGVLFAVTYERTRSTLLVALEHALYGGLLFTLGLGQFFYMGAVSGFIDR